MHILTQGELRCLATKQTRQHRFGQHLVAVHEFYQWERSVCAITWTNHMQKLFQSGSLSAVTSDYSVCCLAKVHLQFEEHPKILVASNCITWRRLMAPVKTAGPSSGCVEGKCFFTGYFIRHVSEWNLLSTKGFSDRFKLPLVSPNTPSLSAIVHLTDNSLLSMWN